MPSQVFLHYILGSKHVAQCITILVLRLAVPRWRDISVGQLSTQLHVGVATGSCRMPLGRVDRSGLDWQTHLIISSPFPSAIRLACEGD